MIKGLLLAAFVLLGSVAGHAAELRVATWNLGWQMDQRLLASWISACQAPYAMDPADRRWKVVQTGEIPAEKPDEKPGWALPWRRDAPIEWDYTRLPPCDVFRDFFKVVPVTAASYARRNQQAARLLRAMDADVIAFQEVSGREAVFDVLPDGGRDYEVCSYEGYKVQRLAFAWRRRLGAAVEPCEVRDALSLPGRAQADRPRPGLALGLKVSGRLIRFLTLHLKSSCVSPLEAAGSKGRGRLAGSAPACVTLQAQLEPLEAWLEEKSAGADHLVLLGDFNRNLGHEVHLQGIAAGREPASDVRGPYAPGARSNSLWHEVNDGDPAASTLTLLTAQCALRDALASLCEDAGRRLLAKEELRALGARDALGCRNSIGLDHIAITAGLVVISPAQKVPLGVFGDTRKAARAAADPLLAVSDHCPLVTVLGLH